MRIAAIVVTLNDGYKLENWIKFHDVYSSEIYKHIIVDNSSDKEYLDTVEEKFCNSQFIKRLCNGGTTEAYNDGIKLALRDPEVDSILLIANDIKMERGGISILYNELFSSSAMAISPILLEKDSDIIADFGSQISPYLSMIPYKRGERFNFNEKRTTLLSDSLTGGITLAKREFYEILGLQDGKLFMYSDEVDMGIRAQKKNISMICTSKSVAWHQHVNPCFKMKKRHPFSAYLIGRNKVYIAKKHFGKLKIIQVFTYQLLISIKGIIKAIFRFDSENFKFYYWMMLGNINGLIGNMKKNKYSFPKEYKIN